MNIGIVIILAIVIYTFKYPFKTDSRTIDEQDDTDEQGLKQGVWEGYEDGQLFYRRTYVNDTIHGLSLQFHQDGSVHSKVNYEIGHFVDTMFVYHSNGQLSNLDSSDSNGIHHGEFKIFYESGQLRQSGNFLNGQMNS